MQKASRRKAKVREWLWRYAPAEIFAIAGSYAGFFLSKKIFGNLASAAYGAAVGENIGFYGFIFVRDGLREWQKHEWTEYAAHFRALSGLLKNLLIEFGLPEVIDSFIIRPAATAFAAALIGANWGVLLGKLAADLVFYVLVVSIYEKQKRKTKNQ